MTGHQPTKSMEDKLRIVLAVLRGEITIVETARREGTSAISISKWRDQFLAGGQQALETSSRGGSVKPPSGAEESAAGSLRHRPPTRLPWLPVARRSGSSDRAGRSPRVAVRRSKAGAR